MPRLIVALLKRRTKVIMALKPTDNLVDRQKWGIKDPKTGELIAERVSA